MSRYYRHLIEDGYLLDIYPNAAAAYSLRKLRDGYTGALFAVRRSVDNALLDVFPNSQGTFDETAVEDWVGYNLFTFSEQLQNIAYIKQRLTVSQDVLTAPDGTITADVLLETVDNNTHNLIRPFGVTNGQTYTYSFFVKAAGRDFIRIVTPGQLSQNPGTSGAAFLNIANGTIVSQNSGFINGPNSANLTITSVGNDWFRVSYTMPCTITSSPNALQINLSTNGTTTSYTGDVTKGVSIWGVQISELDTLKPYQKTETTAGGGGFVQTWYDQSGNGNNATQSTASQQPRIVLNGSIIIINNKPTLSMSTSAFFLTNAITTLPINFLQTMVFRKLATSNYICGLGRSNGPNYLGEWLNQDIQSSVRGTNIMHSPLNSSIGDFILSVNRKDGIIKATLNTNSLTSGAELATNPLLNLLFARGSNRMTGNLSEFIFWGQDYDSLLPNITQEINNYYGIY